MNKVQLAHRLAKRLHITNYESIGYLNALSDEVGTILAGGETITIQNFGVFTPWHQTTRPGRNPKDGTPHDVPARTSVKFKPGKLMLEKLNRKAKALLSAASLLLLSATTGCSDELPQEGPATGWIPVEFNIADIEQLETAPMSTKANALPDFVKTAFTQGDKLTLTYTLNGTQTTTSVKQQADGSWTKTDDQPFMLPANGNNTAPTIKAEFGTLITDNPGFGTSDYLSAQAIPVYDSTNKTYRCSLQFKRPDTYACVYIEIYTSSTLFPPYDHFTNIEWYENATANVLRCDFPVTNNFVKGFYNGDGFTAYGFKLRDFSNATLDYFLFNSNDGLTKTFEITPKQITNVKLSIFP